MSRFIKPSLLSESVYVQFRFQSSLRKYESRPAKKVKGQQVCGNCVGHYRVQSNSPVSQRCVPLFSKGKTVVGQDNTVERGSGREGRSEGHLVSSNKTIRLSKRKALGEVSGNGDELERKIYESLANNQKVENRGEKSAGEGEEEMFLNDFEPSADMDGEEEGEGDVEFGKIQILEKVGMKDEYNQKQCCSSKLQHQENCEINKSEKLICGSQRNQIVQKIEQSQNIYQQRYQIFEKNEEDSISMRIQNLRVVEEVEQIQEAKQREIYQSILPNQVSQSSQNVRLQIYKAPVQEEKTVNTVTIVQQSRQDEQKQMPQLYHKCINSLTEQQHNPFLRARPTEQMTISTSIVEESHLSQSLMQKCLAFQGGRIYVDSQGQNFYISVRVFNKLRRQCSSVDDLIKLLIHQRPYLQGKKQKIKEELEEYLKSYA